MAERVCVAQIGAAHGVRGEVRLKSFTDDPLAVARYGPLETEDGTCAYEVETIRPAKDVLIARLKGVSDRNAAERLKNVRLYVSRARLPEPGSGEFYHADLVGLAVTRRDGTACGTVVAVHNFGAGDLIEVKPPTGATFLLPFTEDVVPIVDLAAGKLVVDPPESA